LPQKARQGCGPRQIQFDFRFLFARNWCKEFLQEMLDHYPILHTMHKGSQVRHLLLLGNIPGANKLIQLIDGVETTIATGTQYEMDQDAMSTIRQLGKDITVIRPCLNL
jgi:hypothetical protein